MDGDIAQRDKVTGYNHHGYDIACLDFGSRITAVEEAHCYNKLAVACTLAAETAKQPIAAGVDGLGMCGSTVQTRN